MTARINRLVNEVVTIVNTVTTEGVQSAIGDSVDNNRTVSVNQTIRFLRQSLTNWPLSADLRRVYNDLREQGTFRKLRRNNNRTDAIDLNELLTVVDRLNTTMKRKVGKKISYV